MPSIVDTTPTVTGRELVVLDPSEEADGRVELDITDWVNQAGIDWGDAQLEAYYALARLGQLPVDFRIPNRQIQIPLLLLDRTSATFDQIRRAVQHKVGLFQLRGGWIKRDTVIGPLYADIVGAALKLSGGNSQVMWGIDADAMLTLEALPDFYGPEIALDDHVETTASELIFTEDLIFGDLPGRVRIVVDDDSGNDQLGLFWAYRCRHYSSEPTAAPAYEAEDLSPLGDAAIATLTGGSGGASNNAVRHEALATDWTPVLSTDLDGVGPLTHTGTYRVKARVLTTSDTAPRVRFVWDVGDLVRATENASVQLPGTSKVYLLDLGEIRLDPAPVGTHQWQGQIQAKGAAGGENITIDKLWLVSVDEGSGSLTAPILSTVGSYVARDDMVGSGNLNGKAMRVGGNWATSGATTDFAYGSVFALGVLVSDRCVVRSTSSDSGPRFALAGTNVLSDVEATIDVFFSNDPGAAADQGLVLRYVDASNYLAVLSDSDNEVRVEQVIGGVATVLATYGMKMYGTPSSPDAAVFYTIRARLDAAGRFLVWAFRSGTAIPDTPIIAGSDPDLETGGILASGKTGFLDKDTGGGGTRAYTNFSVHAPENDAVLFAGRTLELRSDGVYRQDAAGVAYATITPIGDLPRVPTSGMEARTVEVLIKTSRGDLDVVPDFAIDALSARMYYRPSYLFTPDEAAIGS